MAEEEKKEGQGETEQASAAQQDYKKLYEEQQGKYQQLVEQNKKNEEMLDQLTPYVKWDEISGQAPADTETAEPEDDIKTLTQKLNQINQKVDNQMAAIQFKVANPDLAPYESLVGSRLAVLRQTNPRLNRTELLQKAAEEVREFLKSEREKGKQEAEEASKKRKQEEEMASGLSSARDTAPESHQGETRQQYVEARRKLLEQKKNPAPAKG